MCKKRKDSCCCCPTNQIIMPAVPSHGWSRDFHSSFASPRNCCCENKGGFDKFAYAALSQQNNSITTLLTASILNNGNGRGFRDNYDYGHNYHHGHHNHHNHHNDYHGHHGYGHHGYGGYDRWGPPVVVVETGMGRYGRYERDALIDAGGPRFWY